MSEISDFLICFSQGPMSGEKFSLLTGKNILGRSSRSGICLDDNLVSGTHLCLEVKDQRVAVKDLGSSNGSFLNAAPLSHEEFVTLAPGENVMIGNSVFTLEKMSDIDQKENVGLSASEEAEEYRRKASTSMPTEKTASAEETQYSVGTNSSGPVTATEGQSFSEVISGTVDTKSATPEEKFYSTSKKSFVTDGTNVGESVAEHEKSSDKVGKEKTFFADKDGTSSSEATDFVDLEQLAAGGEYTEDFPVQEWSDAGETVRRKRSRLLFPAVIAFFGLMIIFSVLFLQSSEDDSPAEVDYLFETSRFVVTKPMRWTGSKQLFSDLETVFLSSPNENIQVVFSAFSDNSFMFEPLWLDRDRFKGQIQVFFDSGGMDRSLEIGRAEILRTEKAAWVAGIKAVEFWMSDGTAANPRFYGQFAIVRDTAILYIARHRDDVGQAMTVLRDLPRYIQLKPPYERAFFQRPHLQRVPHDAYALMAEGVEIIESAAELASRFTEGRELKSIIAYFQEGLQMVAASGQKPPDNVNSLMRDYQRCLEKRYRVLNKMRGRILQKQSFKDFTSAADLAHNLYSEASLPSERELRDWAWRKLGELGEKR